MKQAIDHSDGVIIASSDVNSELTSYMESAEKPTLDFKTPDEYESAYTEFYNSLMAE